jgi:CRISPR-associated protein Csb2
VLTGRDTATGAPLHGHQHAVWTPLDLDGDGRIDHVLVHAANGLDALAQDAIARINQTWGKDLPTIVVSLVGSGDLKLFARQMRDRSGRTCPELRTAAVWTSRTPFIAPRFRKATGKNAIDGQVRAECVSHGLPEPQITVLPRSTTVERDFLSFVRHRRHGHPQPPDTTPWALTLTFPEPISGPVTLGYASHFGMGLFTATS